MFAIASGFGQTPRTSSQAFCLISSPMVGEGEHVHGKVESPPSSWFFD